MAVSINDPCNRIDAIPDDLTNVLTKFAIEYLTLRPPDISKFGLEFFTTMLYHRSESKRRVNDDPRLSMATNHDDSKDGSASEADKYEKSITQSALLYQVLHESDYFKYKSNDDLFIAVNQMYRLSFGTGECVELNGDGALYVIEHGRLNVAAGDMHEQIDENFGSFSLMQLKWKFGGSELCISSVSDSIVWVLDGAAFQRCWTGDVHIKCRDYESILEFSPIFGGLPDTERQMLADTMATKRYQVGDVIYDATVAGNGAAGCYFIREGLVSLEMNDGDGGIQTVLLKSGQHFGEINSKDEMILCTAKAMTNARCAYLSANIVTELIRLPFLKIRPNLCTRCKNEF